MEVALRLKMCIDIICTNLFLKNSPLSLSLFQVCVDPPQVILDLLELVSQQLLFPLLPLPLCFQLLEDIRICSPLSDNYLPFW